MDTQTRERLAEILRFGWDATAPSREGRARAEQERHTAVLAALERLAARLAALPGAERSRADEKTVRDTAEAIARMLAMEYITVHVRPRFTETTPQAVAEFERQFTAAFVQRATPQLLSTARTWVNSGEKRLELLVKL